VCQPQQREGVSLGDLHGAVGRPVVDHDDVQPGIVQHCQGVQAATEPLLLLVGAHDDRQRWPARAQVAQGTVGPAGHHPECWAVPPGGVLQAKGPRLDRIASDTPLVGKGEHGGPSAADLVDDVKLLA
jgi:hypothetical protein